MKYLGLIFVILTECVRSIVLNGPTVVAPGQMNATGKNWTDIDLHYKPDLSKFIHRESNVSLQNFTSAWSQLTEKEKSYAYYMSAASWAGAKMVFHQMCYEAPPLFLIFQAYFQNKDLDNLKKLAQKNGVSEDQFHEFQAYAGAFYNNMGTYHSFGGMKFIPELDSEHFLKILKSHPDYTEGTNRKAKLYKQLVDETYPEIEKELYAIQKPYKQLGFPHEGGTTAYFGRNMNKTDLGIVRDFLNDQKIDILNTRAFKEEGQYVVTVGSIQNKKSKSNVDFKGHSFRIEYGEFSPFLKEMNEYLLEAEKYAANEHEAEMIRKYITHFETGDIDDHKDSQRDWIKDKGPVVESNLGWIEHYVDPENMRAVFEGWVAIVDKNRSAKYGSLVSNSQQIIPQLPWDKSLEKDSFIAPDFTSLDVVSFAGESMPKGINIPNYHEIREQEGFKNVVFESNKPMNKSLWQRHDFMTLNESDYMNEHQKDGYQVQVAGHELFGHGSGKLIMAENGKCPIQAVDPITKEKFESCYQPGETYQSRFGEFSSSYEECRADLSGLYLAAFDNMYQVFGYNQTGVKKLEWVNMLNEIRKGVLGLPTSYNPESHNWKQAHTQGAWVITQFIMRNQKSKIVELKMNKTGDDFLINLDQEKLYTEGHELVKKLLNILQTYKSFGAVDRAKKFYDEYSKVPQEYIKVRDIIKARKKPGQLRMFANIEMSKKTPKPNSLNQNPSKFTLNTYSEDLNGLILSFADRYPFSEDLYYTTMNEWNLHKFSLKVTDEELKSFAQKK